MDLERKERKEGKTGENHDSHGVQDCSETKVSPLAVLIVLRVLDAPSMHECSHTGVNILVEMEPLLCLGDTSSGSHVDSVEEIWVAVVDLPTEP